MNNNYKPNPVDTSGFALPEELEKLTEQLAKNTHEIWAAGRIKDGWSYGATRDDFKKLHPCLVPYEELPESEKEYDRNTALESLKLVISFGYEIKPEESALGKALRGYFDRLADDQSGLDRFEEELKARRERLDKEEKELDSAEKRIDEKRLKLGAKRDRFETKWVEIKNELDELLYSAPGIVTLLRDGYSGPFNENERILELCREAKELINAQGAADIEQFDFFTELLWQLSIRLCPDTEEWLSDYIDKLSDILLSKAVGKIEG